MRGLFCFCRSASGAACRVPPRGGLGFAAHRAAQFVGSRPTASSFLACPRKEPKKGTRGCAPATHAASDWPSAKVGSALPRISGQAFSIPPAAAPRAQCLCLRVSETVPEVRPGRYGRGWVGGRAPGGCYKRPILPQGPVLLELATKILRNGCSH